MSHSGRFLVSTSEMILHPHLCRKMDFMVALLATLMLSCKIILVADAKCPFHFGSDDNRETADTGGAGRLSRYGWRSVVCVATLVEYYNSWLYGHIVQTCSWLTQILVHLKAVSQMSGRLDLLLPCLHNFRIMWWLSTKFNKNHLITIVLQFHSTCFELSCFVLCTLYLCPEHLGCSPLGQANVCRMLAVNC